jgi:excisionase family DNA binding protein
MDQPLTVLQAAERAQLHRQTIADALRAGTLHGGQRKARGTWRIQTECLDAWLIDEPCSHARKVGIAA